MEAVWLQLMNRSVASGTCQDNAELSSGYPAVVKDKHRRKLSLTDFVGRFLPPSLLESTLSAVVYAGVAVPSLR